MYRLASEEWGLPGDHKYISAFDAMSYPKLSIQTVEDIITKKQGDNVLNRRSGWKVQRRYHTWCEADVVYNCKIWGLFGKAEKGHRSVQPVEWVKDSGEL